MLTFSIVMQQLEGSGRRSRFRTYKRRMVRARQATNAEIQTNSHPNEMNNIEFTFEYTSLHEAELSREGRGKRLQLQLSAEQRCDSAAACKDIAYGFSSRPQQQRKSCLRRSLRLAAEVITRARRNGWYVSLKRSTSDHHQNRVGAVFWPGNRGA
jgi:hypothetical protein